MAARSKESYTSPHGIEVGQHTEDPNKAYRQLRELKNLKTLTPLRPDTPITAEKVRIVCISDTHCKTKSLILPPGDILLHAGDFTSRGRIEEVQGFANFMEKQPHKHKVVIAGNHELSFGLCDGYCDPITFERLLGQSGAAHSQQRMKELNVTHPKDLLKGCIYLDNSSATVCGLKIWGSPWSPYFMNWAYNAYRGEEILRIWDLIPTDTDILMTHGPPLGIGDQLADGDSRAGCLELYNTVTKRVQPKLHVFGHIHEDYSLQELGSTIYANASTCSIYYKPTNPPICIDLDLPIGFTKEDVITHPIQHELPVIPRTFICGQEEQAARQTTKNIMSGILSSLKKKLL